jgi:cobalamin-dependent methionine synthase I
VYGARETKGREEQRTDNLVGKFVRKNHLKYVNVGGKVILKYILKKQKRHCVDWIILTQEVV